MITRRQLIKTGALVAAPAIIPCRALGWPRRGRATSAAQGQLTIVKTFDTNTGSRASPGSQFGGNPVQYNGKTLSDSFFDCIDEACHLLEIAFCATPYTLRIQFGFGTINNTPTGALGTNGVNATCTVPADYTTQFKPALSAKAVTSLAQSYVNGLPGSNPFSTFPFGFGVAWGEWMGLPPFGGSYPVSPAPHAYVCLGNGFSYTWSHNDTFQGGTFDAVGVVLHENTEAMCRTGVTNPNVSNAINANFTCYTSAGTFATSQTGNQYISLDGGVTKLYATNCQSSGDMCDLQGTAYVPSGGGANFQLWEIQTKQWMDCMGWQFVGS